VRELLTALLLLLGLTAAAALVTLAAAVNTVRRRTRVTAGPKVPLRWALWPTHPARLHRRLVVVDRSVSVLVPRRRGRRVEPMLPAGALAAQVREMVARLDGDVCNVASLPRAYRGARLTELELDIVKIEASNAELHALIRPASTDVADLSARVHLFAEAYRGLDATQPVE
jgi:hypothetical protein